MSVQEIIWDLELIKKYNYSGPRYTSYPTALEFHEQYTEQAFNEEIQRYPERSLSIYIHIPFCHKLCYFCACNKVVTRQKEKADEYLDFLIKEIESKSPLFSDRLVTQLHWGGGTPTFLNTQQISRLMTALRQYFNFAPIMECSLELDPREIELDVIDHLYQEGFNRLSMGVQDFDKTVQKLVNREQSESMITALFQRAREVGFESINIDLIYGLPKQTLESFLFTLQKIVALSPDRLSVFNYAHIPSRFAAQRKIKDEDLPSANEKLELLQGTISELTASGYQFIGMDHFALPNDELAIAQREKKLHRNFQGYTTQGESDLLGLGVSAISMIGNSYAQNQKDMNSYYEMINRTSSALWKGLTMTRDDCIRRDVIKDLICNFNLKFSAIEERYMINFEDYFAKDLPLLNQFTQDGLVMVNSEGIEVTPQGRLLIRNICMCFDTYLSQEARLRQFSKVI